jgi:hypothetical protein
VSLRAVQPRCRAHARHDGLSLQQQLCNCHHRPCHLGITYLLHCCAIGKSCCRLHLLLYKTVQQLLWYALEQRRGCNAACAASCRSSEMAASLNVVGCCVSAYLSILILTRCTTRTSLLSLTLGESPAQAVELDYIYGGCLSASN